MSTDFLYAGTLNVHWLSLLCTYTCARRFGYPQDTTGILRMPRYPQDASGILRIRYPQDTAVSSGYRVLRIPARVLGYGVPRIPPPILGICRCPQDAPRVPGRQTAFTDVDGRISELLLPPSPAPDFGLSGRDAPRKSLLLPARVTNTIQCTTLATDTYYGRQRTMVDTYS